MTISDFRVRPWRVAASIFVAAAAAALLPLPSVAADWPQAHSDMPADPAILFGKLPNGMRYAIMRNATPKEAVAMRLAIAAGSLQESDAQQGLAHFLEHMAFRGSRNVPESEVWPGLQRLGMTVGADANASTGWTATQYEFNLPHNDDKTVDAGLLRLREIASELTLAQRAMDDERGVILSEERLRDTVGFRSRKEVMAAALPGTLAMRRFPIGLTDIIKHAPVSLIRDFYDAYYRPERATLIVVGDIDPRAVEAKILAGFGNWQPIGPAGGEPASTPPGPRGPEAGLFVDPGASSALYMSWVSPQLPDSLARERDDMAVLVGFQILGYRLNDIATGPQHPFADIRQGHDRLFHAATLQSLMLVIRPQDWRIALDAADTAARRIDKFGVSEDEVKRARDEIMAEFQNAAAQAGTRPSPQVADLIAQSADENEVLASPAGDLALATSIFKDLTADTVNVALRAAMRGHGPLAFVISPVPIEGGKAAVAAALAAAEKSPLTAETARASIVWPYTSFGVPGTVAERTAEPALGATFIRFANGVRLTVKQTDFAAGDIAVDVRVGSGRLGLSPRQDTPRWAVSRGFIQGGMKAIDYEDMRRILAGKVYQTRASMTENGLILSGHTRPTDLPTQLQVFAAYVNAPGFRAEAFDRARTGATNELEREGTSPGGVLGRDVGALLRSGDRRWMSPSPVELAAAKPQELADMLAPALASGPIEVTMVGDITADAAIQAVAVTFGALPRRSEAAAPSAEAATLHFPPGTDKPVVLHHRGRADQGMAVAVWPATDRFALKTVAELRVLKNVLATRLNDQLRVRDGATYSPSAALSSSDTFPGFGYLLAAAELPAAKMPLFFDAVSSIAADLKAHPISADELDRARRPLVETILADRQTNDYWTQALTAAPSDPRIATMIVALLPDLAAIDAGEIQRAAQAYLSDAKIWKLEITPEPGAAATTVAH